MQVTLGEYKCSWVIFWNAFRIPLIFHHRCSILFWFNYCYSTITTAFYLSLTFYLTASKSSPRIKPASFSHHKKASCGCFCLKWGSAFEILGDPSAQRSAHGFLNPQLRPSVTQKWLLVFPLDSGITSFLHWVEFIHAKLSIQSAWRHLRSYWAVAESSSHAFDE